MSDAATDADLKRRIHEAHLRKSVDADACGFLNQDNDDEAIGAWLLCHALAARPRPIYDKLLVIDDGPVKEQWRSDTADRVTYFGRARKAKLTRFEVTEETPPHPDKWHIWLAAEVT